MSKDQQGSREIDVGSRLYCTLSVLPSESGDMVHRDVNPGARPDSF